jgi:hypothetical protein
MKFYSYQHICRFGTEEVEGIDIGTCYIFSKLDGSNGSLWGNNPLRAGSRNRELSLEEDNQDFMKESLANGNIINFFKKYKNLRLFGEWLVPHTLKTYENSAWRKFYVFDVREDDRYLPYEEYQPLMEKYKIDYIPLICKIKNPTYERLIGLLENNIFLIKDGLGTGEGIVIKNYEYRNKFGRQTWAKIVKNEFKIQHGKNRNSTEIKEKKIIEDEIVDKYVTIDLIEKEFAKIKNESGWSSKDIPKLLQTVFYCLVKEEAWNFIKKFKYPIINFKKLSILTTQKIKEIKSELF